jgi:hypothetical protein
LVKVLRTCFSTVPSMTPQPAANAGVGSVPSAISASTSPSRALSTASGIIAPPRRDQLLHPRRIHTDAPLAMRSKGFHELRHIGERGHHARGQADPGRRFFRFRRGELLRPATSPSEPPKGSAG